MAGTPERTSTTERPERPTAPPVAPLDRNALNLPNAITISRLLLAFVLFALIYIRGFWITSAVLFLLAAATDALDGWVARRYGMITTLGRILDPFVDKMIVGGAFVFLLGKPGSGVDPWMVIIVLGREMFITSLRAFLEQHGRDFSASLSGKLKMATQCAAVTVSLLSLNEWFGAIDGFILFRDVLLWTAVVVTLYSGLVYIYRGAQMLRREPE
jgi:CDP-diacylglycerol---glycerol-3-phosphate 3-phosphatidyltransferase